MQSRPDASDIARRAFDWIGSVAVEVDGGLAWLEDGTRYDDLYSGTAGVLLAAAEATAAGLDVHDIARGAVGRLLHLVGHDGATIPDDGLFTGWSGIAIALRAWSAVPGDGDADAGAAVLTEQIARRVLTQPADPARYTDIIEGDAGILITLLGTGSPVGSAADAAGLLADRLAAAAEADAVGGFQWRMTADWPSLMPGFSHGTAGVAYALALTGRALDRADLIAIAERGAETLLQLGHTPDGWALPLTIPRNPDRPPVNYGWCHGPAGTARLFVALDEIDPQPRWSAAIDACVQALRDSRLPARLYPGYWDNLARCCGTAGVGQLLLDRYQTTGDAGLLDWADILADDVIERTAITVAGARWSNAEHTRTPPDLPPEPGLMQGAAGIASWLARLDALRARPDTPPDSRTTTSWL